MMWCVCCKPSAIDNDDEGREGTPPKPMPSAAIGRLQVAQPPLPARANGGVVVVAEKTTRQQGSGGGGGPVIRLSAQELERRREKQGHGIGGYIARPRLLRDVPRGLEGEQVSAGWPAWLAAVAGEAIRGWVPRRADSFEKLDKIDEESHLEIRNWVHSDPAPSLAELANLSGRPKCLGLLTILEVFAKGVRGHKIGQGTYSNVYRARDLDNGKVVALKKVRFDNLEPESVRFMAREIHILRRLDHPNIIKLEGLVTSRMSCSLYLVFQYMEHDLSGLASFPGLKFTEPQVKCYVQQLLRGLDHCHSRNILHRDIKGSNLLIDNKGILKIGDFGLASFFDPDQHQPLTSRVVTLWYRPPELLLGATNYGVAVDLWSTGCILAELYAGKPIMPGRTEVEQLHKIFKLCGSPSEDYWRKSKLPHATIFKPQQPYKRCVADTFKDFPASTLALMEVLLSINPADRGTAASALKSEYFTRRPLACDPSSLPKYPPSKEFDVKIRDEEARRMGAAGKVQKLEFERKGQRESMAIPAPDANAELPSSLKKRQSRYNSRSRSEKFNIEQEEVASGFPIEPPSQVSGLERNGDSKGGYANRSSHSGPLVHQNQWAKVRKNEDESPSISAVTRISASSLHAIRRTTFQDDAREQIFPQAEGAAASGRLSESGNEPDSARKYDQLLQSNGHTGSHRKEDDRFSSKDQLLQGYGTKGNKIHYSGPLCPSGNFDQTLKDHDRHIQEVFRRSRLDKSRVRRIQAEGNKAGTRPSELGGAPIFPSSRGTSVFPSSRGVV